MEICVLEIVMFVMTRRAGDLCIRDCYVDMTGDWGSVY